MIRFVTGTDTGVGKTVASAVLAWHARAAGRNVSYVKPVQTGLAHGAAGGDAEFVAGAARIATREVFRFDDPLAPAVAAERVGKSIDFEDLTANVLAHSRDGDLLLVEGAGGLLAPLDEHHTMADLAAALGAELVVATRPGLGTLNHTALTLEAAARRELPVAGLVVGGWPSSPGITETTNLERLRAMAPVLAVVPRLRGLSVDGGAAAPLRRALEQGRIPLEG